MPTTANAVRWTPRRIQQALRCPKPAGALSKAMAHIHGRHTVGPIDPRDRQALRWIASHADLIEAPPPLSDGGLRPDGAWLLVPAPSWVLRLLFTFEAESEDFEIDDAGEDSGDAEPDVDEEDGGDEEADLINEPNIAPADHFGGPLGTEDQRTTVLLWQATSE